MAVTGRGRVGKGRGVVASRAGTFGMSAHALDHFEDFELYMARWTRPMYVGFVERFDASTRTDRRTYMKAPEVGEA